MPELKSNKFTRGGGRNSNLELFRIVSMIMIVAHHFVVNSDLTSVNGIIFSDVTNYKSIFLLIFGAWGKTGINCFMLITGYFMCKSNINVRKYIKLLGQIYVYRVIIYIVFFLTGYETFGIKRILELILPFTKLTDNFTGCFLVFFLCIPFLNVLVHNMSEKMHKCLLVLLIMMYVVVPSLSLEVTFNYVIWFCVLYIVSSYIRLYPKKIFTNTKFWGGVTIILLLIAIISIYILAKYSSGNNSLLITYFFVSDCNKILAVLLALSAFMFFKNINITQNKLINTIGSTTFGVLCIHANSNAMRTWLWKDMIDCVGHYATQYMPLYAIGCVIGIFVVCSMTDLLRIKLLEKPFMKLCDSRLRQHSWYQR